MAGRRVIAKIVEPLLAALQHHKDISYPRFLWTSLWITMFISLPGRAGIGLLRVALQMISADNTAKMHRLSKQLKENP